MTVKTINVNLGEGGIGAIGSPIVQLIVGDTLRFACSFTHSGPEVTTAKLRAVIGNKGATFDEILWTETLAFTIPASSTPLTVSKNVDVVITTAIASGFYEAYVKLMSIPGGDIFWYGALDDIQIIGDHVFSTLTVTYSKV